MLSSTEERKKIISQTSGCLLSGYCEICPLFQISASHIFSYPKLWTRDQD